MHSKTISENVGSFFGRLGTGKAAAAGVLVLVLLGAALFFLYGQPATQEVRALVLSSGAVVEGATVQVLTQDGSLIASGVTGADGKVFFSKPLPRSGRVILKVSKNGFVSASGEREALAVIDLSRNKPASIEIYSSEVVGGGFEGGLTFIVLDKLSSQPVSGASINAIFAGQSAAVLSTNEQGRASLQVPAGANVRIRISASGYFSDSRAFTAIRPEETILLSARSAEQILFGSQDEIPLTPSPVEVKSGDSLLQDASQDKHSFSMQQARLAVTDSQGNAVEAGTILVVSESGQEIASAPISNGVAGISDLLVSKDFSIVVTTSSGKLESGKVQLFDAATNNLILSSLVQGGKASLSPTPLSTLGVTVQTSSGEAVASGSVRAYDSATSALLAQAPLFNGFVSLSGNSLQADSQITLVLDAPGFSAPPTKTIFGRVAGLAITATPVASGQLAATTIKAFDFSTQQPISASVRVFKSVQSPPIAEAAFSASTVFQLDSSGSALYSASFSAPGYYPLFISAFPAGATLDAVLVPLATTAVANECYTLGTTHSCSPQSFSPTDRFSLAISTQTQHGTPIAQASVSVRDSLGRSVFVGRTGGDGKVVASGLQAGSYSIDASSSGATAQKQVSFSSDSQQILTLELKGTLLLSAKSIDGSPVEATFTLAQVPPASCTGSFCTLRVSAADIVQVAVSAPGFHPATATRSVSPGQLVAMSFQLSPDGEQLRVAFSGAEDSQGRAVSSLLAGHDYFLKFSFYSAAQDETIFSLRLGEASSVAGEGFGIQEFDASRFEHSTKSTSYSPQPTCVDYNNGNSQQGLYKWMQLFFENKGAPVHRIVSIPVRVKANSPASMPVFYRLSAQSGSVISRNPFDPALGTSASSASKDGCYASENRLDLKIGFPNSCRDGTREGQCSDNVPLSCQRAADASLQLSPKAGCCPLETILSEGQCVFPQAPSAGKCADSTGEGQCSTVNKPKACVGGQLVSSSSC